MPPGQEFTLPVGADDAIRVSSRLPTTHEQTTGLIVSTGSKRTVTHAFAVRNGKGAEVEVVVRDRVPTSGHQDVKVSVADGTTVRGGGVRVDYSPPVQGELSWAVRLPPGAEQELVVSYTVEWPKGKRVVAADGGWGGGYPADAGAGGFFGGAGGGATAVSLPMPGAVRGRALLRGVPRALLGWAFADRQQGRQTDGEAGPQAAEGAVVNAVGVRGGGGAAA